MVNLRAELDKLWGSVEAGFPLKGKVHSAMLRLLIDSFDITDVLVKKAMFEHNLSEREAEDIYFRDDVARLQIIRRVNRHNSTGF
jgi:hypothetical protein